MEDVRELTTRHAKQRWTSTQDRYIPVLVSASSTLLSQSLRSTIGSLLYATTVSRTDIAAVHILAQDGE